MTTQNFTAPGSVTHEHAGGLLTIHAMGGKGGIIPMFEAAGAGGAVTIAGKGGQRVVNGPAIELPEGDVTVHVNKHSGVSEEHPIEITITSF